MLYIVIIFLIWFLLSTITIKIKNIKRETDVLISFGFLIKLHLDYDKFIKRINILKEPQNLTIEKVNNYIRTTFVSKKLYDDVCKYTTVKKFNLYKVINIKNNNINILSNTLFFITTNYISNYLNNKFKKIENEKYDILRDDFDRNEYDFELAFKINVFWLLKVIFTNFKTVKEVIRINRRVEKNGSSNSYTA